jgi:methanogenic corrinoid protein MtbC1
MSFMSTTEFRDRLKIADAIRTLRSVVAEEVTSTFLARHPDWQERYGELARKRGIEDAGYHQDFLAAAIESGEMEAFNEYGEWAAHMLEARRIEPIFLVENLRQIGDSLRGRLPAPDADMVESFIRSGIERCLQARGKTEQEPVGELGRLAATFADTALRGDRQGGLQLLLEAAAHGHPVTDLYADVLQPAMYRIGRMWEANRISVAQEHMATAITQFVIAHLYSRIEVPESVRGKGVVTGVEGEFHQVGANMVADMLEAGGWDVRFLGTDTPISGVLGAIEEHKADILGISTTMILRISSAARLIDEVRAKLGTPIKILVGGSAFRSAPSLYREIGADGYGFDLRSALALANRLTMPEKRNGMGQLVLIADDDPGVRKWLGSVLEKAGFRTVAAANGREAIRMLGQHEVDLILLDLVMPEQEGLETIPLIRSQFPATKIIAISGAFGGSLLLAAKVLGASEVISKPIAAETLFNAIRQTLSN